MISSCEWIVGSNTSSEILGDGALAITSSLETKLASLTLLKLMQRCLDEKCLGNEVFKDWFAGIQQREAVLKVDMLKILAIM